MHPMFARRRWRMLWRFLRARTGPFARPWAVARRAMPAASTGRLIRTGAFTMLGAGSGASAQCPAVFEPAVGYGADRAPLAVVVADFNGDGVPDLAASNRDSNNISIFLGNLGGTFQTAVNYVSGGSGMWHLATGDFNRDGRPDLATANRSTNNVSILLGNPGGTFQGPVNYPVGAAPFALAVGDLNGDRQDDLAVANEGSNNVSILRGAPDGTFGTAVNYPVGVNPRFVAIAHLNQGSAPDLAVANYADDTLSILLGNDPPLAGTFAPAVSYGAGDGPCSIAVGDFNSDLAPDLAAANFFGSTVSVHLGQGAGQPNGTFQPPAAYSTGGGPLSIAIGDFNADGVKDLATANYHGGSVSTLLGAVGGAFGPPAHHPTGDGCYYVAVADFDRDGSRDLASANAFSNNVSVLLNANSGYPTPAITQQPPEFQAVAIGSQAEISISAEGYGSVLGYQWRRNQAALVNTATVSGVNTRVLTIFPASVADSGSYDVQVSAPGCGGGSLVTTSHPSLLAVCTATGITQHPLPATACPSGSAMFTVAASGTSPIYQWQRQASPGVYVDLADGPTASWDGGAAGVGAIVSGSASPTLTIGANTAAFRFLAAPHAINYRCLVSNLCGAAASGPGHLTVTSCADLTVGDVTAAETYSPVGTIRAYSFGVTACNIGAGGVQYVQSTPAHPVCATAMYRLSEVGGAARFEQIGQSWAFHETVAVSLSLCGVCMNPGTNLMLGPGCSKPSSGAFMGQQSYLGAKSEVNPNTGLFPYPFFLNPPPTTIGGRLQVAESDLTTQNATYYTEAQFIAADDAQGGNGLNNASYRRIGIGPAYSVSMQGATSREKHAVEAWKDLDPGVTILPVDYAEGAAARFLVASRVTDLGNGLWQYEYAIQNVNSDRAARLFSVPIPTGVVPTAIEFHDVPYHSGEPYSGVDWTPSVGGGSLTWATQTFAQTPSANALRWGTLYNFRFRASTPPTAGQAHLGLYKPGTPASLSFDISVPSAVSCYANCDGTTTPPLLNVNDFICFQARFAAGDPYADCDRSGSINVNDFICFQGQFAAGCP